MIQRTPYSESSQVIQLITAREGRVSALAKGAFRARSSFGGPFDLVTMGEADLSHRSSDLDIIYSFNLKKPYRRIRSSLVGWAGGCYIIELAAAFSLQRDHDRSLYPLLEGALDGVEGSTLADEVESWLLGYALQALARAGLAPLVDTCVGCGSDVATSDGVGLAPAGSGEVRERPRGRANSNELAAGGLLLSPAAGGFLCANCSRGTGIPLSPMSVRLIRRLAGTPVPRELPDSAAITADSRGVDHYLEYRLERPVRSRHRCNEAFDELVAT